MLQPNFCAICGSGDAKPLTAITIQGQPFAFCEGHAAELRPAIPTTLTELQRRFGSVGLERRALGPRRLNSNRQVGPNHRGDAGGRRITD